MLSSLLVGSLLFATPGAVVPAAQLAPPSIFSGRRRGYMATEVAAQDREIADGKPVPVRCKSFAPSLFSGRVRPDTCELEIIRPTMDTGAPAIFSGRSPKRGNVLVGQAAYAVPPTSFRQSQTVDSTGQTYATDPATGQTYPTYPEKVYTPAPTRRAPSIFSGRRAPRAAPAQ